MPTKIVSYDLRTAFVILAAGKGSRMKSNKAKVMQHITGVPMLEIIINNLEKNFNANKNNIFVIVNYKKEQITNYFKNRVQYIKQQELQGTADAIKSFIEQITDFKQKFTNVIVLYGDTPLIKASTIKKIIQKSKNSEIVLLTTKISDPKKYGRIIKEDGLIKKIVEYKEANEQQKQINLINTGIIGINCHHLAQLINKVNNDNSKNEYYLTDIVAIAVAQNLKISELEITNSEEAMGANDMVELYKLEQIYQQEQRIKLMTQGIRLIEPNSLQIRGLVEIGTDVEIDTNVILIGKVKIGNNVKIGAGVILNNINIGNDTEILPYCHLENSIIGNNCSIGPFARMRNKNVLENNVKIGNFVELKKTNIKNNTKANHLTYLGDSSIGEKTNIGAGTITCNYDGSSKHSTKIGNNTFIGSNSTLIAPIEIADQVFVAAGSTLTDSVKNPKSLAIGRTRQVIKANWQKNK